jgi:hypothetical protein
MLAGSLFQIDKKSREDEYDQSKDHKINRKEKKRITQIGIQ